MCQKVTLARTEKNILKRVKNFEAVYERNYLKVMTFYIRHRFKIPISETIAKYMFSKFT